jgi:hypothetical protein
MNHFIPEQLAMCEPLGAKSAEETTMNALAGFTTLAIVMIGVVMLTKTPEATPRAAIVELTEDPHEGIPPFIHFDSNEWR